jgi:hypothetical protein
MAGVDYWWPMWRQWKTRQTATENTNTCTTSDVENQERQLDNLNLGCRGCHMTRDQRSMNIDWVMKLMRKMHAAKAHLAANEDPTALTHEAVLAEIHKMQGELARLKTDDRKFIAAATYIMDEDCAKGLKTIIERTIGTVDHAVPYVLKSDTFDDFLSNAGLDLVIDEAVQVSFQYNRLMLEGAAFGVPVHNNPLDYDRAVFVVASNHAIYMNSAAHWYFDWSYGKFKKQQIVK